MFRDSNYKETFGGFLKKLKPPLFSIFKNSVRKFMKIFFPIHQALNFFKIACKFNQFFFWTEITVQKKNIYLCSDEQKTSRKLQLKEKYSFVSRNNRHLAILSAVF